MPAADPHLIDGSRARVLGGRGRFADPGRANAGLWFEKLMEQPQPRAEETAGENAVELTLEWVAKNGRVGDAGELDAMARRRARLLHRLGGSLLRFSLETPLLTGLGVPHAGSGNGMHWHRTLGVPYVPASSIKGAVRNWVETFCVDPTEEDPDDLAMRESIDLVFGREVGTRGGPTVGAVIVFDGIPVARNGCSGVKLAGEIVNPHYRDYYGWSGDGRVAPPADWYDPVPVPRIAVAAGELIDIGIAPRPSAPARRDVAALDAEEPFDPCTEARRALEQMASMTGLGAASNVGFGRLRFVDVVPPDRDGASAPRPDG